MDKIDTFWSKVDKTPGQGPNGECWEWRAGISSNGYGQSYFFGKTQGKGAHVISWTLTNGPTNLHVLHHCDNRLCVNPSHLFIGSNLDNTKDRDTKGRHKGGRSPGVMNKGAKMSEEDILKIRGMAAGGMTQKSIAKIYNLHHDTILKIVNRKLWKHLN